jgi:uncharacterized membrane protein YphA (DoxX/SURF4 family)
LLPGRRLHRRVRSRSCDPPTLSELIAAPFVVAAGLLVVSGFSKIRRPGAATRALEAARLPAPETAVRLLGSFEVAVGAACLVVSGPVPAALLAVSYGAFAAIILRLTRVAGSWASCGCLGEREAPPSVLHLVLNLVAAGAGVAAALAVPPSAGAMVAASPMFGVPLVLGWLACAYSAYAAVVYVPRAWGSYRPHAQHQQAANMFRLEPFAPRREAHA